MFSITELAGGQAIVEGQDRFGNSGNTLVSTVEWDEIKARATHEDLHEQFDAAIEEFYAPLIEALDALQEEHSLERDAAFYIVEQEAEEGSPTQSEVITHLSTDSVILRMIEQDAAAPRLRWMADNKLVILKVDAAPAVPLWDVEITGEDPAANGEDE